MRGPNLQHRARLLSRIPRDPDNAPPFPNRRRSGNRFQSEPGRARPCYNPTVTPRRVAPGPSAIDPAMPIGEDPGPSNRPSDRPLDEPRNFWAWVAYQFFYRIGWQFKMEATLMAGVVSYLAPAPWVMGLLTALNTLGRNLSPLVAAPITDRFASKRGALWLFWSAAVFTWGVLTLQLWLAVPGEPGWTLWFFGACYTLFFTFLGMAGVAQGALLGKIIPADRRGSALAAGMTLSGLVNTVAILVIFQVLQRGRFPEPRNYALAFTLTTAFFVLAGVSLLFIREPATEQVSRRFGFADSLRYFVTLARGNRNLARLMVVNVCVGVLGNMLQFYTAFWRHSPGLSPSSVPTALMLATLLQTVWQSSASGYLGRVADRQGNRRVICGLLWIEAVIPLIAIVLGTMHPFHEHWAWYLGVYSLVGLRFPVYQLLVNYLLEIVPQHDHAMALGAVNAVGLLTAGAPLLFGWIAQQWGYPVAFAAGSVVGFLGAWTSLGLEEVRVRPT